MYNVATPLCLSHYSNYFILLIIIYSRFVRGIHLLLSCHDVIMKKILETQRGTWWRHQMGTFSALLALCAGNSPVPGEFPAQRPVTRSFDVFFDLRQNKLLSKQPLRWWFETPPGTLWLHCNDFYCCLKVAWFDALNHWLKVCRDNLSINNSTLKMEILSFWQNCFHRSGRWYLDNFRCSARWNFHQSFEICDSVHTIPHSIYLSQSSESFSRFGVLV